MHPGGSFRGDGLSIRECPAPPVLFGNEIMIGIIHRHIFKELITLFCITIVFLTFIFMMTQLLEITDYIVNYNLGLSAVVKLIGYNMPFFLQFIIPMAVMVSVLLTFLRMSGDNEIVALKASGVSIVRLLRPVLLFSAIGCFLTAFTAMYALPKGRQASKMLLYEMAVAHLDIGLKSRHFIDTFKGVLLYVHHINTSNKRLTDIFIEDRRSENMTATVIAPRGRLILQPEQRAVLLQLFDGTIHQVNAGKATANAIVFDNYAIRLDTARKLPRVESKVKDEEDMGVLELKTYLDTTEKKDDQYYIALMEWHKKFSLPVACVILSLLGVPLGIQAKISKRSMGIGLGLAFFLLYYLLLSLGWAFGEAGLYPPVIGMWMPNIVILLTAVILLRRAVLEKPWPAIRLLRLIKR